MPELIVKEYEGVAVPSVGPIVFLGLECNFWAWSPYNKCSFRCVYCSVEAQGKSKPAITVEEIDPLFTEFAKHQGKYPLGVGASTDAYPPEEEEHRLMRSILPALKKHQRPFIIATHGDLVTRDIDLLQDNPSLMTIGVSITHHDDAFFKRYEPGAPNFEARVNAVNKLHRAGIPVHVNICPWIPGLTDADAVARQLPADIVVNVGPLSYNHQHRVFTKYLFGRETPSAERSFQKHVGDQAAIHDAYLEAYRHTRKGTKGNLKWLIPPGSGKNYTNTLP